MHTYIWYIHIHVCRYEHLCVCKYKNKKFKIQYNLDFDYEAQRVKRVLKLVAM